MTEEIKQRNESKEFLKDLQYYLFQNKRSPKIDKLSVLLDNDEKRISELESTNKKISDECHKLVNTLEKKQKENAELKHTIATLRQEKDNVSMHAKAMEVVAKTRSDQLTKAKDLLAKWVELYKPKLEGYPITTIQEQTEQFISEVEK